MIRTQRSGKVSRMTSEAIACDAGELPLGVTGGAIEGRVSADELEVRLCVIERRVAPTVHRMARLAVVGELARGMIRGDDCGEFCRVARVAACWSFFELQPRVAFCAPHSEVLPHEREARRIVAEATL